MVLNMAFVKPLIGSILTLSAGTLLEGVPIEEGVVFKYFKISSFSIRPFLPVPSIRDRSILFSLANRRTEGMHITAELSEIDLSYELRRKFKI